MTSRKFYRGEPTRPGNPCGLTINQHVFPASSITRFVDLDGMVSVFLTEQRKVVRRSPYDKVFCARRAWNEAIEHGLMKRVEDDFRVLAKQVLEKDVPPESQDFMSITRFHFLCRLRQAFKELPGEDVGIPRPFRDYTLTKESEENAEKNGYITTRSWTLLARHKASIEIMAKLNPRCLPDVRWDLVYSRNIEFLVPDSFQDLGVVPLTPNRCLLANAKSGEISDENAVEINRAALARAERYYFARDLAKCGI